MLSLLNPGNAVFFSPQAVGWQQPTEEGERVNRLVTLFFCVCAFGTLAAEGRQEFLTYKPLG